MLSGRLHPSQQLHSTLPGGRPAARPLHALLPLVRPPRQRPAGFDAKVAASSVQESSGTLSYDSHTVYKAPEGWQQVLVVQVGVGCDLHGQSSTKAAARACRHAIEYTDLPCVHDMVPGRYEGARIKVKVGCPNPGMVDLSELKAVFPYGGQLEIEVVEGGLRCKSWHVVPELGESGDDIFVAVAAVTVGF